MRLKSALHKIGANNAMEIHNHGTGGDAGCHFPAYEGTKAEHTPPVIKQEFSDLPDCKIIYLTLYKTAQALLASIISKVSHVSDAWEGELKAQCASLLNLAETLQRHHIGAVYIRLTLSLRILGTLSPCAEQRRRFRRILEKWRLNCGVGGICTSAILALEEDEKILQQGPQRDNKDGAGGVRKFDTFRNDT
jgi:hypothetical protein